MIEVQQVSKFYRMTERKTGKLSALRTLLAGRNKRVIAVEDMNFYIPKGGFVGYIGPNGAGKSTTIKMLTGILHPDEGKLLVGGASPQRQRKEVAKRIGVVFGQRTQLWWDLPVRDSFEIIAAMYQVSEERYRRNLQVYGELLDIPAFIDTPVRKLSLGQRMRADLCAALLHDPDILFLDEPTIGLDVVAKTRIRQFLKEINENEKKTILLTTHDMDDIEQLCKRIMIINHGKKVYDGSIEQLRANVVLPSRLEVDFAESIEGKGELSSLGEVEENRVRVSFDKNTTNPVDLIQMLGQFGEIRDLQVLSPKIEDVIQQIYSEL